MRLIGIAGKKQSGKNTVANILHGIVLKEQGMISEYTISPDGQLLIKTDEILEWAEFDITRKDNEFISYAERAMYPYVKLYSFADSLKTICIDLFEIPPENVFGTNEQKDQPVEHLRWENMPGVMAPIDWSIRQDCVVSGYTQYPERYNLQLKDDGPMTAREFMQHFGTDIMRKIWEPIWCQNTVNRITEEQSELAIVADVRFPNEVDVIKDAGGIVIKLNRNLFKDEHPSETQLDKKNYKQKNFDYVIENQGKGKTIARLQNIIEALYKDNLC
jgi:energy-coupling factor transporter ATP-binding protein EcfA2